MLTRKQKRYFWDCVRQCLGDMGLGEWVISPRAKEESDSEHTILADVASSPEHCAAAMTLYTAPWGDPEDVTDEMIQDTAYHECLHILLSPIMNLAEERFCTEKQLAQAEHDAIRRLLSWRREGKLITEVA